MRIMKIFATIILLLILSATTLYATESRTFYDDKPIAYSELPAKAKEFIDKYFHKEKASHVSLDRDIISNEYNVVFASGIKIEFNGDGTWKEIDCRYSTVPHTLIPEKISAYIKEHYPNSNITELKRERGNWEVKLTGGMELTFNKDMRLVEIDD